MIIDRILTDIQNKGFSVQEHIFAKEDLLSLKTDILNAYHNNSLAEYSLKAAGIGKNADLQKNIRGDQIHWLQKEHLSSTQEIVWDFLETLKVHFNQNLFFGLKGFETHVTVYPVNTFYKKHIDQFRLTGQGMESIDSKFRKISFILYLNEDWEQSDGGELRLFDFNDQEKEITTVLPQFGRGVFFLSEDFPHEVLETRRERVSMTGWFYQ
ncbi:MAG: 2OG-Fe(II) oxygenase [Bdellovibrionota bacterium]